MVQQQVNNSEAFPDDYRYYQSFDIHHKTRQTDGYPCREQANENQIAIPCEQFYLPHDILHKLQSDISVGFVPIHAQVHNV